MTDVRRFRIALHPGELARRGCFIAVPHTMEAAA
jgi:hypothetical protein